MTEKQRELARHALGLPNKTRTSYRNHFCAGAEHSDYPEWVAMVEQGDAIHREGSVLSGGDDWFWLTDKGAMAALLPREKLSTEDFPATKRSLDTK